MVSFDRPQLLLHDAEAALADFHAAHFRLQWDNFTLTACRADGPIGPELDLAFYDARARHACHVRCWRMEGPGWWSTITHCWPEIMCSAEGAERIAQSLQAAFTAGQSAKAAEFRAVLGLV